MRALEKVGFLIFPHLTALDVVGPAQVFSNVEGVQVHLIWKDCSAVITDAGYSIVPTHTLDTCPQLDLLCIPGGPGQPAFMKDPDVLAWIARQASGAGWVTSVCSGSLLLAAAGTLDGYRAGSHWNYREQLHEFGSLADPARVVVDRNRITGGGCTAGIDFALTVVAKLCGEQEAKEIQLLLEYAPQPPFSSGRPEDADPETIAQVKDRLARLVRRAAGR